MSGIPERRYHGRETCADEKGSGIAEVKLSREQLSMILVGKYPDSAGRHSRESAIAVGKEFGMAESNFVTKNARSEVKEFATEMLIEIAFLLSVFPIRTASPVTSR